MLLKNLRKMATTSDIKRRITSINNTAKITKALQMMSAAKMQKAQQAAQSTAPYAQGLYEIVNLIGSVKDYKSPFLRKVEKPENILIVIVGPNGGFVGTMLSSLALAVNDHIKNLQAKHQGLVYKAICVNSEALKIANMIDLEVSHSFVDIPENAQASDLHAVVKVIKEGFSDAEYDEVYLAYPHFVNTVIQKPMIRKILPIEFEEEKEEKKQESFVFEPNKEEVLNMLLPEYFETQILSAVLETKASEESARMVSMKNATENAMELQGELVLKFNRTRQAKITTEIIDIVAGSIN